MTEVTPRRDVVPFREAVRAWFTISLQTFGGPAGQIAVMQRHLVDERRWIGQKRFLHALNYCMLLPGPEAQQLAIYIGWLLNGLRGGLVAGTLKATADTATSGLGTMITSWPRAISALVSSQSPRARAAFSHGSWKP